jgi:hypothetical protein
MIAAKMIVKRERGVLWAGGLPFNGSPLTDVHGEIIPLQYLDIE